MGNIRLEGTVAEEQQQTVGEAIEEARRQPLTYPVKFICERVKPGAKPIIVHGKPQLRMEVVTVDVETVQDMAEFYKACGKGELHPVPDLSLQCLNIMLDLIGKLAKAGAVRHGKETGTPG